MQGDTEINALFSGIKGAQTPLGGLINDQKIIGGYFLDVKANGGCPLKIKTDYGTENVHDSSKVVLLLWVFVLQVVRVCFLMACGHLLGKG